MYLKIFLKLLFVFILLSNTLFHSRFFDNAIWKSEKKKIIFLRKQLNRQANIVNIEKRENKNVEIWSRDVEAKDCLDYKIFDLDFNYNLLLFANNTCVSKEYLLLSNKIILDRNCLKVDIWTTI